MSDLINILRDVTDRNGDIVLTEDFTYEVVKRSGSSFWVIGDNGKQILIPNGAKYWEAVK